MAAPSPTEDPFSNRRTSSWPTTARSNRLETTHGERTPITCCSIRGVSPYRYAYRQSANDTGWELRGYVLLSTGPSGARHTELAEREDPDLPANGLIDENYLSADNMTSETHDNLLAQP